jgi:Sec-independent protein translocase protein TatA
MHLGDSIFILILALVLLGPKKTAELAQQLGKLMGEFRKASNDFKFQFNEEMRVSEQQEQKRARTTAFCMVPASRRCKPKLVPASRLRRFPTPSRRLPETSTLSMTILCCRWM